MKNNSTFRRALAVLLAAAMTFALTGCSVRELHIGQVEVNTGAGTAWITPARGVDKFDIPAADFSAGADGSVTYTGTAYRVLQRDYKIDMPLVFDWENIDQSTVAAGDTVRTAEMTGEDVTACAAAFCETVTAAGYDAAVYGNRWQGYYDYDFAQLGDYAFWVSAPGTADDFYYAHDFWQYSYDGTVPGVSGSVDRDLWFVPITT